MAYVNTNGVCTISNENYGKLVVLTKVLSAAMSRVGEVKIEFNRKMRKNTLLVDPYYYALTPITPGAVTPYINSISTPDVINPSYVTLDVSGMTNGATYKATVAKYGPSDIDGLYIDELFNNQDFSAIGEIPTIKQITAISETIIDVKFTKNMKYNPAIRDVSKYTANGGLSIISILEVSEDTVKLVTSEQSPGVLYTLSISNV